MDFLAPRGGYCLSIELYQSNLFIETSFKLKKRFIDRSAIDIPKKL
jgi:hypothetical protein